MAEPAGDRLDDVGVVQRPGDVAQDVDQGEQPGPLALQLVDPVLEPLQLGRRGGRVVGHGVGKLPDRRGGVKPHIDD